MKGRGACSTMFHHVPAISWSFSNQGGAHGDHHQTCLRHQPGSGQLHVRVRGEHGLVGRQSEADALGDQVGQREVPCLSAIWDYNWIIMGYGIVAIILLVRNVGNGGMGWWLIVMDYSRLPHSLRFAVSHEGFHGRSCDLMGSLITPGSSCLFWI